MDIPMCKHYEFRQKPWCTKLYKASVKCHVARPECKGYEPSYGEDRRQKEMELGQ